jgi:hypothetical protein
MSKGRGGIRDVSGLDWHASHEASIGICLRIKFVFTGIYSFITSSLDEVLIFCGMVKFHIPVQILFEEVEVR